MPKPVVATPQKQDLSAQPAAKTSPMMAQYGEIKAAHPDVLLFYRMGDFYELFFEDAEQAAAALNIVLTKRGRHLGEDIPMCGVPVERADDYLARLIAKGFKVAVCEQVEDPAEARKRGGKSVVKRAVVRLVTPGTLTEEALLNPRRSNCLVAVVPSVLPGGSHKSGLDDGLFGLAAVDISTGTFQVMEVVRPFLGAELARIEPAEIIAPDALCQSSLFAQAGAGAVVTPLGSRLDDEASAERRITNFYGLATLDGLAAFTRAEKLAAAAALFYVERTQCGVRPALATPGRLARAAHMEIDAATRANLELTQTLAGRREGSLADVIDKTVTAAGGRLLSERLVAPLTDPQAIGARLATLDFLIEETRLADDLQSILKTAPDLARALSRIGLGRGGPRDLASLRDGFSAAQRIGEKLDAVEVLPRELTEAAKACLAIDPALVKDLRAVLADNVPLHRRDGNFIRPGYDDELDQQRALRDESRQVIAALQARYCELAETRQLKVKHNNFLGFFLELPQAQGEKLLHPPFDKIFNHRQTMADAMRFSTAELAELEAKISGAAEAALARENDIFDRLAANILEQGETIREGAAGLARIDVALALALLARRNSWTRPRIDSSLAFEVEAGRHPVVEMALKAQGKPFIANRCGLTALPDQQMAGEAGRIAVVTGPNMGGKSTYLRQNALIAILAQMGSYVPAAKAHIGIVDRLFSRVGAADDLARGRSTFMVEMVETAAILNQASPHSFVILDEIGRGTATFDGLAIAVAVVEHLHEVNRARTLFATHFGEVTALAKRLPRLLNLTVRVVEGKSDLVFLHEIVEGTADHSHGIQVAKLAGLPKPVIARAKHLLTELEKGERRAQAERLVADLPLFAGIDAPDTANEELPPARALIEALDALDPDQLSPREAMEALYRLKTLRAQEA
ncbi:DNA mismatch repair protein MutS [Beijerinckia indica]|uniref:DNA mismatch repair protein MutS n=1 Tax=Beijerinckia indica subsp. indica (strain ATCC 9039 / DSM 1715 / NCIMB 8712) TaxID=395963 RepID=B2IJN2_BEII9|nr:DNA mismatch repair protein MutS [Beijerinckia indica]ACB94904.1 DNA mismatch repair protein MutS [Beijerinckia indica subsp. indica ATCC 9039]